MKSSDFQVTALGTEFNVTAYPDEEEVTATLISGKVLVEYNNQQGQEILKPNEQLAYNKRTRSGNVLHPDMQDVTAWTTWRNRFPQYDIGRNLHPSRTQIPLHLCL